MTYGIQIKNNDNDILIDSNFDHYHYAGKLTYYEKTRVPGIVDIKIPPRGQRDTTGMSAYQQPGDIFKYKLFVKSGADDFPPMAFINPQTTTGNVFAGIIKTTFINDYTLGDYWDIWVLQDYNHIAPILYCFLPIKAMKEDYITDAFGGYNVSGLNEQGESIPQDLNFSGEILDSASIDVGENTLTVFGLSFYDESSNTPILPYTLNYPRRLYLEFSASNTLNNLLINIDGVNDLGVNKTEINYVNNTNGVFYTQEYFKEITRIRFTNVNPAQTITFKIGYSSNSIGFGDRYGISTFNSDNQKTYDSRIKPLKIVGAGNAVSGNLPRNSAGSASSFNPDFRPNNYVEHTATLSSYQQNDMMYFIPSISHAVLEQTRYQSGDGSYGSYFPTFYKYAREDFWWTFYRGTYRLNDHTSTEHPYILTSSFSILGGGHVADYDYDEASLLEAIFLTAFGAILGLLTGGIGAAIFFGAVGLVVAANGFQGVSAGTYFPYRQGSRNTGQNQTFLISRASYYD